MERAIKPMTPEIKAELLKKKEIAMIRDKIYPDTLYRTKFRPVKRGVILLPEGFTGADLKRAKKLMRKKDHKNLKKSIK